MSSLSAFSSTFTSEFSSKLDGVILPGSVDDAALPVITKKNRSYKWLQKPPESTYYVSDSCGITSKNVCKKQVLKGIYEKNN